MTARIAVDEITAPSLICPLSQESEALIDVNCKAIVFSILLDVRSGAFS